MPDGLCGDRPCCRGRGRCARPCRISLGPSTARSSASRPVRRLQASRRAPDRSSWRRRRPPRRTRRCAAAARGRRRDRGQDQHDEFAFLRLGTNPHYGTPGNPADRMRVPGGSSSAVRSRARTAARDRDRLGYRRLDPHSGRALRLVGSSREPMACADRTARFRCRYTLDSIGPMPERGRLRGGGRDLAGADADRLCRCRLPGCGSDCVKAPDPKSRRDRERALRRDHRQLAAAGARLSEESLPQLSRLQCARPSGGNRACRGFRDPSRPACAGRDFDPRCRKRIELAATCRRPITLVLLRERAALRRPWTAAGRPRRAGDADDAGSVAPRMSEGLDERRRRSVRTTRALRTRRRPISSISPPSRCRCRVAAPCRSG